MACCDKFGSTNFCMASHWIALFFERTPQSGVKSCRNKHNSGCMLLTPTFQNSSTYGTIGKSSPSCCCCISCCCTPVSSCCCCCCSTNSACFCGFFCFLLFSSTVFSSCSHFYCFFSNSFRVVMMFFGSHHSKLPILLFEPPCSTMCPAQQLTNGQSIHQLQKQYLTGGSIGTLFLLWWLAVVFRVANLYFSLDCLQGSIFHHNCSV